VSENPTQELRILTTDLLIALLVDTGSSSFWVGNNKTYVPTSSSVPLNESFYISYGTGDVFGDAYTDTITIASGITVTNQTLGISNRTGSFEDSTVDGILGLAQVASTVGTLPEHPDQTVPTLTCVEFRLPSCTCI